jgi:hypothetical protein
MRGIESEGHSAPPGEVSARGTFADLAVRLGEPTHGNGAGHGNGGGGGGGDRGGDGGEEPVSARVLIGALRQMGELQLKTASTTLDAVKAMLEHAAEQDQGVCENWLSASACRSGRMRISPSAPPIASPRSSIASRSSSASPASGPPARAKAKGAIHNDDAPYRN